MNNIILEDRYELLRVIGRGGMSIVHLAYDLRLDKQWAVKEIRSDKSENQIYIDSLVKEANLIRNLDSKYFPRIVDIVKKKDIVYIIMDYIDGKTADSLLEAGPQTQENVICWGIQLSEALSYLHSQNPPIIYRDMKPQNVMITSSNEVRLIDFGTAREYKFERNNDTTCLGTPGYAAPEQYGGIGQTDERTDVYSLGKTLFHLVTGINPTTIVHVEGIRYYNRNLSSGLEKIIEKALQPNPKNRYQTCIDLKHDLENYQDLDNETIKKEKKKLIIFSLFFILTFICLYIFFVGKANIRNKQLTQYYQVLSNATQKRITNQFDEALGLYDKAIVNINGYQEDAYQQMIDLYRFLDKRDFNNGEVLASGLNKIEGYINQKLDNIDKNEKVLFKIGFTYFSELKNYEKAVFYLGKIKKWKNTKYYYDIAYSLIAIDIDFSKLENSLDEAYKYFDSVVSTNEKLEMFYLLTTIYSSYKNQIKDANNKILEINEKYEKLLFLIENEEEKEQLKRQIYEKNAQAYYSKYVESKNLSYVQRALDYYERIQVDSKNESNYIEPATLLYELGKIKQAEIIFDKGIKAVLHPEIIYVKWIRLKLEKEYRVERQNRNYNPIVELYKKLIDIKNPNNESSIDKLTKELKHAEIIK